jgi:nitronate monooxygenase
VWVTVTEPNEAVLAAGVGADALVCQGVEAGGHRGTFEDMLCPEAGTSAAHREALKRPGTTALTRAFSGRRARGIVNDFTREHEAQAPSAYPYVHHLTAPLRAAARAAGDLEAINLWAGQAYALAQELPAAQLARAWSRHAQT